MTTIIIPPIITSVISFSDVIFTSSRTVNIYSSVALPPLTLTATNRPVSILPITYTVYPLPRTSSLISSTVIGSSTLRPSVSAISGTNSSPYTVNYRLSYILNYSTGLGLTLYHLFFSCSYIRISHNSYLINYSTSNTSSYIGASYNALGSGGSGGGSSSLNPSPLLSGNSIPST